MSKLKSLIEQRAQGPLTGRQRKTCFDCVHVLPGPTGNEVTCEVYTFKYERYGVRRMGAIAPSFAHECAFYKAMTPEEKTTAAQKFREFYRRLR